jgi:phospholipase C
MHDIDHVVVLMLENRSFDHMLGYLAHPDPSFHGINGSAPPSNPGWSSRSAVATSPRAKRALPYGPDHSHDAVMQQLAVVGTGPTKRATNQGFVQSYERKGRGLDPPKFGGLFGGFLDWFERRKASQSAVKHRGPLVMLCQDPDHVPVLSKLALEFAVCTRWFSSVPGETWPNRNFVHAATSAGQTDIVIQPYSDRTIFQVLECQGKNWHIYHDDTPQVWAFPWLWDSPDRHARWFEFKHFAEHVQSGMLPQYSFIEPNHRPPVHTLDHDPVIGSPDVSDNQHPENNLVTDAAYANYDDNGACDFAGAESLIASVYEALRRSPEVFERTILLVTYDEHGGLFDREPPDRTCFPRPITSPNEPAEPAEPVDSLLARLIRFFYTRKAAPFDFKMLGVRVPAVIISPYIRAGTIDPALHDHASVPATLHDLFAPEAAYLTERDRQAAPFHTVLNLTSPRKDGELPNLGAFVGGLGDEAAAPIGSAQEIDAPVPAHYKPFLDQALKVHETLAGVQEHEAELPLPEPERAKAAEISRRFALAAARHRTEGALKRPPAANAPPEAEAPGSP